VEWQVETRGDPAMVWQITDGAVVANVGIDEELRSKLVVGGDVIEGIREWLELVSEEISGIKVGVGVGREGRVYVGVVGGVGVEIRGRRQGWIVAAEEGRKVTVMSGELTEGEEINVGGGATIKILEPKPNLQVEPSKLGGLLAKMVPRKTGGTVYLDGSDRREKARKLMRVGGVVFVMVVLVLVGIGQIKAKQERIKKEKLNQAIEQVVADYQEAVKLVELNPVRSRELADQAQAGLDRLSESARQDKRLDEVKSGLGEVLGAAVGVKAANTKKVLDLSLVREDFRGAKMRLDDGGNLVVLDVGGQRVTKVDPDKKSGTVVVGKEQVGLAELVATYPGKLVVVNDKGVVECTVGNGQCKKVVEVDEEWGEIKDVGMFAGNIYLLDGGVGKIWKYPVIENGYGAKQEWLANEVKLPSKVVSMSIDGMVWVGGEGEVKKYVRGVEDRFEMGEINKKLGNDLEVEAQEDGERLVVLDRENARVVIFKKDGSYVEQYQEEKLSSAKDVVLDEKARRVYVLWEKEVGEIDIE
jgi:hypothetical protein